MGVDHLAAVRAKLAQPIEWGDYSGPAYGHPDARRLITRDDPLAFAVLYLSKHLTNKSGVMSLSEVHVAWADAAREWITPPTAPQQGRRVEVGPRDVGKSTWNFIILPMWAAAHGHSKFVAAFANTPTQAETHLASFKAELDNNELLRMDYPDLVRPKTRGRGVVEADRVSLYHSASGFVFSASGMDSSNLGLKVGDTRPDLIIMDDIEPDEAQYSAKLAKKRLGTLRDAILPLNIYARVVIVGTVTMADSIVHQLVQAGRILAKGDELPDELDWVTEERFVVHHYLPIVEDEHGVRRSAWPEKWPLEFLESMEGTRTYAKNYANDPVGADGDYWTLEVFKRAEEVLRRQLTHVLISVDPAVTTKESSDYTGISAIGFIRDTKTCVVLEAKRVKLGPDGLRAEALAMAQRQGAGLLLVETNQGGELWLKVFGGLPIPVKSIHQSVPKPVRAANVLHWYERGHVLHMPGLAALEGEMVGFPNAPNDDMVDATGSGINYFLRPRKRGESIGATSAGYI